MSLASEVETIQTNLLEENKSNLVEGSEIRATIEQKLIDHLFHNELQLFKQLLDSIRDPPINVLGVRDKKSYNFLHIAALNNQAEIACYLYDFARKLSDSNNIPDHQRRLREWTNEKTDEGFTPLHLAAFRGNLKIITLFVENGADVALKNKQGLNCLHIAAQGDQAASLTYFKEKNLDINQIDNKGSTPLHWASYLGCENAVTFILSWNPQLDLKDQEGGLTPLHLAVISGNSRVVRKLLIKGSDRSILDNNNKTPADLARDNEYINILGMLEESHGFQHFYNIKTSFKPTKKKMTSLLGFFTFFFVFNPLIILFTFPFVRGEGWIIVYPISVICALFFFLTAWLKDPGYLYKKPDSSLMKILEKGTDCTGVCPDCEIIKPLRSKHCDICNRCVGVYDHHCPWINNCVGMKNHRYFLAFIISVWSYLLITILMLAINFQFFDAKSDFNWGDFDYTNFLVAKIFCSVASLCVGLFFFIPLSILVAIQIKNFLLNKTTAERFGHSNQKNEKISSFQQNSVDFDKSLLEISSRGDFRNSNNPRRSNVANKSPRCRYINNCYAMCFGNENNLRSEQCWLLRDN